MMLYGAMVLGMVLMTEAPGMKGDGGKKRVISMVGLALLAFFFSLMLSIFKGKAGGYPYTFLLK